MIARTIFQLSVIASVSIGHDRCFAQPNGLPNSPLTGLSPAGAYAISDIESINTINGNILYKIPLGSLPAARSGSGFQLALTYNSKSWEIDPSVQSPLVWNHAAGWQYGTRWELEIESLNQTFDGNCSAPQALYTDQISLISPDGGKRVLRLRGHSDLGGTSHYSVRIDGFNYVKSFCTTTVSPWESGVLTYYTVDGSFLRLEVSIDQDPNPANNTWTLYFPDGGTVTGTVAPKSAQTHTDRNGNSLTFTNTTLSANPFNETPPVGSHEALSIEDQFGRFMTLHYHPGGLRDALVASGPASAQLTWMIDWINEQGTTGLYTPYDPNVGPRPATIGRRVAKIQLPEQAGVGQAYQFTYSPRWGEVQTMTLPTSAAVTYTHFLDDNTTAQLPEATLANHVVKKSITFPGKTLPDEWTYYRDPSGYGFSMTAPDGGVTINQFHQLAYGSQAFWNGGLAWRTSTPDKVVVERVWVENVPYGGFISSLQRPANNPFVEWEFRTYTANGAPEPSDPMAAKRFVRDKNGNVLEIIEYDWATYSKIERPAEGGAPTGVKTSGPALSVKRTVTSSFHGQVPVFSNGTDHPGVYHNASVRTRDTILTTGIKDAGSNIVNWSEFSYDSPGTTANVVNEDRWNSRTHTGWTSPLVQSNRIRITREYESQKNNRLKSIRDGRGILTTYSYEAVPQENCSGFDVYPTAVARSDGDERRSTRLCYDLASGVITKTRDIENDILTTFVVDVFGRPTLTAEASGTNSERRTEISYDQVARKIVSKMDVDAAGDGKHVSILHYDPLGRVRLQRQLELNSDTESQESTGVKVETRYGYGSGFSYEEVSQPFRATDAAAASAEATMGWTRTEKDAAGRIFAIKYLSASGGVIGSTTYTYDRATTTTTEVATGTNRSRHYKRDALGRLSEVIEDYRPGGLNLSTVYTHDSLDKVIIVNQGGQLRSYLYDTNGRLVCASNPESRTDPAMCSASPEPTKVDRFFYDGNGNLISRYDARDVVVTMAYDSLDRLKSKNFSGGSVPTPAVTLCYDGKTWDANSSQCTGGRVVKSIGRLSVVASSASISTYSAYDELGRVTAHSQRTAQYGNFQLDPVHSFTYSYKPAGLATVTNPVISSGNARTITYAYDRAARVTSVSGQLGTVIKEYTSLSVPIAYAPHGGVATMTLGNGRVEQTCYNARLQPLTIRLGTAATLNCAAGSNDPLRLSYAFNATKNDGNPESQTISRNLVGQTPSSSTLTQSYTYDTLNRLDDVLEGAVTLEDYTFDRFGNRWLSARSSSLPAIGPELLNPLPQQGSPFTANNQVNTWQYDGAGNLLSIPGAGRSFIYDAENRQVTASTSSGTATYSYDGNGRRVKKVAGGQTTIFVYDAMGMLAMEIGGIVDAVQTQYLTADHLGSTRLVTDGSGNVVKCLDYLPFGEQLTAGRPSWPCFSGGSNVVQKFTGKERDAETGLDYFGARYMSAAQGRFTSPDTPFVDQRVADPQSWNMYAYVRNNPLKNRDPNGQICIWGFGNTCNETTPASTAAQGAATGTGAQMLNDGVRRGQYQQAASELSGPAGSAGRKALQAETYAKLSPIGKGLTDAAKVARVGQLAGKTSEQLAQSASRTSGTWNAVGSASKTLGAVGVVVGVGMAASNIASAPEGQRGQVVAGQAGALGGGLAGGYGGAALGGFIGSFFVPGPGTAVGAFIGGLAGGGGGAVVGEKTATVVYKRVEEDQ